MNYLLQQKSLDGLKWETVELFHEYDEAYAAKVEAYKKHSDKLFRVIGDGNVYLMKIIEQTMADGPGLRTSVYSAGCSHHCPGCYNKRTWDINNGTPYNINYIIERLINDPCKGITFSGGDPLYQPEEFIEIARRIKAETDKNIWCYTGYTYEQVKADPRLKPILNYVDVLVDGRFEEELADRNLQFRGSSNQRIIVVLD